MEDIKIFAMTHKKFEVPKDSMYIPMHVGHKNAKEEYGYLGDDTGDNISDLNCYYAELSGQYWVWKNYKDAKYVGLCHYRRYFINDEEKAYTQKQYLEILKEYDIITSKQLELPNSYHYGFGAHHKIETLDETGNIIKEKYPAYYENFITLVNQNKTYFANMIVAPKNLFDAYSRWLFDIFFELQKRIDLTFEDDYHKRVFGFISEFLLYVYVKTNKLKAYESRVAVIGEKTEIHQIRENMKKYFKENNPEGAKTYLEEVLKVRPDVIMEASDTTGECKICMQAISTALLEKQEYKGKCFLNELKDYDEIIRYFKNLNQSIISKDDTWINSNNPSKLAVTIARKIYEPIKKA